MSQRTKESTIWNYVICVLHTFKLIVWSGICFVCPFTHNISYDIFLINFAMGHTMNGIHIVTELMLQDNCLSSDHFDKSSLYQTNRLIAMNDEALSWGSISAKHLWHFDVKFVRFNLIYFVLIVIFKPKWLDCFVAKLKSTQLFERILNNRILNQHISKSCPSQCTSIFWANSTWKVCVYIVRTE